MYAIFDLYCAYDFKVMGYFSTCLCRKPSMADIVLPGVTVVHVTLHSGSIHVSLVPGEGSCLIGSCVDKEEKP